MPQKFAIAVPSLNQGSMLAECLNSIVSETRVDVFVSDAGSTDETTEVLKQYGNSIRWRSQPDKGQADAINKAFAMMDGNLMGYMNCDDGYMPGALDTVAQMFEDERVHVVAGWAQNLSKGTYQSTWGPTLENWGEIAWLPVAFEPATFWRREVWETEGPFNTDLRYVFGWDFLCRASKRFCVRTLQQPIAFNRLHGERKTVLGGDRRQAEILGIVRSHATPEQVAKYEAVLAAPNQRLRLCADFRPARVRSWIYERVLPELAQQMLCDEALRIYRVLRGW